MSGDDPWPDGVAVCSERHEPPSVAGILLR
jgi:hypothetical protein